MVFFVLKLNKQCGDGGFYVNEKMGQLKRMIIWIEPEVQHYNA